MEVLKKVNLTFLEDEVNGSTEPFVSWMVFHPENTVVVLFNSVEVDQAKDNPPTPKARICIHPSAPEDRTVVGDGNGIRNVSSVNKVYFEDPVDRKVKKIQGTYFNTVQGNPTDRKIEVREESRNPSAVFERTKGTVQVIGVTSVVVQDTIFNTRMSPVWLFIVNNGEVKVTPGTKD